MTDAPSPTQEHMTPGLSMVSVKVSFRTSSGYGSDAGWKASVKAGQNPREPIEEGIDELVRLAVLDGWGDEALAVATAAHARVTALVSARKDGSSQGKAND